MGYIPMVLDTVTFHGLSVPLREAQATREVGCVATNGANIAWPAVDEWFMDVDGKSWAYSLG